MVTRLVNVDDRKPRILYFEGEPRWEFKFLRRAVEDDQTIRLDHRFCAPRQNKIYRQVLADQDPNTNLVDGFPTKVQDLFDFDGLIIGSVDAPYLKPEQQQLIHEFVDRRGGGLLFLGGQDSLADGGYARAALNDLLPTVLPETKKKTFVIDAADVELTAAGRDSLITRIEEDPDKNVERWKKLPYLMNFQDPGQPKPGAVGAGGRDSQRRRRRQLPLLITRAFRPRAHGDVRHGGKLALADAAAGGRQEPRDVLPPVAALAGERYAAARDRLDAAAVDLRRIARQAARRGARHAPIFLRATPQSKRTSWDRTASPKRSTCGRSRWSRASIRRIGPRPSRDRIWWRLSAKRGKEESGPRHADVPPRRRRRREFPRRAESRVAGKAFVGNRRAVL